MGCNLCLTRPPAPGPRAGAGRQVQEQQREEMANGETNWGAWQREHNDPTNQYALRAQAERMLDHCEKPTLYVGGKMTGVPLYNFPAFDAAKARWESRGYAVTTPADITRAVWREKFGREFDPSCDTCEYGDPLLCEMFARDAAAASRASCIALLPDYHTSKGARIEIAIARQLGKSLMCAETGMPISLAVAVLLNNEIPAHVAA